MHSHRVRARKAHAPARDKPLPVAMNFQQLRSVRETVRCGFNLSEAAVVLEASQSGVSRQIRDLENELGILLFKRSGKRLTGLTSPGDHLLPICLLYTSPSPRDLSTSRMPSSA